MILRNSEWVNEPADKPEKVPKKKKKRVVTAAMIAANRLNATKSVGPGTEAKERTRFNATRHGMASREIMFLPDEDPRAFWAEVDLWCLERGAITRDERTSIANAVYSVWVKTRAINAQVHAVTAAMDDINDHFAERKVEEVRDQIVNLKERPESTIAAVMNYTYGCELLIAEFTALSERLETHYSFEVSQREHALRLGGHRPKELFTNKVVTEFNRSYFGSLRGPGGCTAAQVANALMYDRPDDISEGEFERRLERIIVDLPTIEAGHAELKRYVHRWIAQLTERKELMGYREERQKKAAIGKAQSDVSAEGQIWVRYINQADRTYNAAIRTVLALKADRRKFGAEDREDPAPGDPPAGGPGYDENPDPETASGPVELDPQPELVPAVEAEKPSKAVTTQVADHIKTNNAAPAAPGSTRGPLVPFSPEEDAAIRAQYRASLARVQAGINQRTGGGLPDPAGNS